MEGAFLNQTSEEGTIKVSTDSNATILGSTWHVSEITPNTTHPVCQAFDDITFSHVASGFGDTLLDTSEHNPFSGWLRRRSMFSSPGARKLHPSSMDESPSPNDHHLDQALLDATSPTTFHSGSSTDFKSTQGILLPSSISPNTVCSMREAGDSGNPVSENTLFDINATNALVSTTPSSYSDITQLLHQVSIRSFPLSDMA